MPLPSFSFLFVCLCFFPSVVVSAGSLAAVYFVGEPRTLSTTFCSIVDSILKPLQAQQFNVTVFTYTQQSSAATQYDLFTALPGVQVLNHITDDIPDPPAKCISDIDSHRSSGLPGEFTKKLLSHMYVMEQVDTMRRDYERQKGVQFDWVIFAHPELTYAGSIPDIRSLSPSRIHVPVWHSGGSTVDGFAIIPRPLTAHYFGLYTDLCVLQMSSQMPARVRSKEQLYRWFLSEYRVPISAICDFFYVRTRGSTRIRDHFFFSDLLILDEERCLQVSNAGCCHAALEEQKLVVSKQCMYDADGIRPMCQGLHQFGTWRTTIATHITSAQHTDGKETSVKRLPFWFH